MPPPRVTLFLPPVATVSNTYAPFEGCPFALHRRHRYRRRVRSMASAEHPTLATIATDRAESRRYQRWATSGADGRRMFEAYGRPSDRFSHELVLQTIGFLERAEAIEDGERLLRARGGLEDVTHEPFGAGQCS